MSTPPPNDALAELAAVLGDDNVRTLVRTFLRDFLVSFQELGSGGERKDRHRIAHSLKSNSRLMGAHALSRRMAELEIRLAQPDGPDINAEDLAAISAQFEEIAAPLRKFVGPG
jgi:HPt (histidine-containing phosphotransfer) domain-containing protein